MHCLPSQGNNPYLRMDVPLGPPAYVEQTVSLPATPARLTVRSWGFLWPTVSTISVRDAAGTLHVLGQFVQPFLEANFGQACSGAGNGTMNLLGDVTSYAPGDAVVQNGTRGSIASGGNGIVIEDGQFTVGAGGSISGSGSGGGGVGFAQSGGSVTLDGMVALRSMDRGGHDVAYGQTGGTLGGSGTIDGSLVADAGVISPGSSPGRLTITSNFVQGAGNTLRIEIAGRQPGQFDQLRVAGSSTLAGRAEVRLLDSFAPDIGEQFPFLICTNVRGAFTNVVAPQGVSVSCSRSGVAPVVTGVGPTQILGLVLSGSNAVMTFGTVSNRSYTVERTADVGAANWQLYTNLTGTEAKVQVAVPAAGAGGGSSAWCSQEGFALGQQLGSVVAAGGRGRLRIGEIERPAAEHVGLQWNPGVQVGAGLNGHSRAGGAIQVETEDPMGEAEGRVVGANGQVNRCAAQDGFGEGERYVGAGRRT